MVKNSMNDIIQRFAMESIGETDFKATQAIKDKYFELMALQAKFPDDISLITMIEFTEGVETGKYSLSGPCTYYVIEGTEENPILGTVLTEENLQELSSFNNYVGFSKLLS